MTPTVSFTKMENGTRDDYLLLERSELRDAQLLPSRIIKALERLDHSLEGYPISRLQHSLQSATRAMRDGADDELIVAALIHDVGDDLAPYNHAAIAAELIRPYVRAEVTWIVEQHGLFQCSYYVLHLGGDRNMRDRYRDHPWYEACAAFCEKWDQCSFDPAYDTLPLEAFVPLVEKIFSRKPHDARYVGEPG